MELFIYVHTYFFPKNHFINGNQGYNCCKSLDKELKDGV